MSISFWQRLETRTAAYHLLRHPFYQAWTAGTLSRADLAAYASEYWHHVSAFPTYLSALHARLPDGTLRREVLRNLADEEGLVSDALRDRMDAPSGRPHSDLWMDFANAMGASRADVVAHQTQPEMQALLATFRDLMQTEPAAALCALYAYESRVPAIAREKAIGLKQFYGADTAGTRYFTLHQTADVHHAQVWRDLIDAELLAHPAAEEPALAAAERAAQALWSALDGVERQRLN